MFHCVQIGKASVNILGGYRLQRVELANSYILLFGSADDGLCEIFFAVFENHDVRKLVRYQIIGKVDNRFKACLGFRRTARKGRVAVDSVIL